MIKSLEAAIDRVRKLPPDEQEGAATMLEMYAAIMAGAYRLTPRQEADLDAGLREADEGRFASDEEMRRLYRKFGL